MKLKAKFTSSKQSFKPKFGAVVNLSDGGYEQGYAKGNKEGYTQGKQESEEVTISLIEQFNTALDSIIEEENRLLAITFKISGEECGGLYGWRWNEWVYSDYNIYGITTENAIAVDKHGNPITLNGEIQCDIDHIVMNAEYTTLQGGDGNG